MSMEQNGNQNMGAPTFCRNGCGFYAAQAFDGMCSKCYKDLKELQQATSQGAVAAASSSSSSPVSSPSLAAGRVVSVDSGNKKTDVDIVATSLSRTSLGDMNLNSSSNSGDKLPGSSNSGGAVGGVSEVETGSPTVASTKAAFSGDKGEEPTGSEQGTSADGGDSGSNDGDKGKKAKKNRCMECRKKVGLTGFQCHCGKLFCSLHRYSDTHDCTFDFKEQGAQEIRKNNPVVKGEKVQKI